MKVKLLIAFLICFSLFYITANEKEMNGLHFKIKLKNYITVPDKLSKSYRRPGSNRFNKSIYA